AAGDRQPVVDQVDRSEQVPKINQFAVGRRQAAHADQFGQVAVLFKHIAFKRSIARAGCQLPNRSVVSAAAGVGKGQQQRVCAAVLLLHIGFGQGLQLIQLGQGGIVIGGAGGQRGGQQQRYRRRAPRQPAAQLWGVTCDRSQAPPENRPVGPKRHGEASVLPGSTVRGSVINL